MHLLIQPLHPAVREIYANHSTYHPGDAGLDLFCPERIQIPAGTTSFKLPLGIACENTDDHYYYLYPRSSMGTRTPLQLANSVGIIDPEYRGEITGIVDNLSTEDYVVEAGQILFQLVSPDPYKPVSFKLLAPGEELGDLG